MSQTKLVRSFAGGAVVTGPCTVYQIQLVSTTPATTSGAVDISDGPPGTILSSLVCGQNGMATLMSTKGIPFSTSVYLGISGNGVGCNVEYVNNV